MDSVVVDGVRIAYQRVGEGPTVVLAGGTGMPIVAWELSGLRDALVHAGFEVIAYAARGVAPSAAPPAPYTIAELTGDLAGLLDALGVTRASVVGYSLGSFTTELLARTRPDLVHTAVLLAGAGPATPLLTAVLATEAELIAATGHIPPATGSLLTVLTGLSPTVLRDDPEQVATWVELAGTQGAMWTSAEGECGQSAASSGWIHDPGRMAALAEITAPVLVAAFEHDLYFPPAGGRAAAALLPTAEFVRIPDAAHAGLMTHPKETIEALVGHLLRHRDQARN
ncbi:alpha/beta fold hydrolase [Embleya sp. NBC_00896]|uniref:alpha/beta fold hydrolase n=1 Tax=Embleya sp. NBC_00896 TaxID=2975961 RepID=UPI003869813E|nr:alpha/beta hydrolase [Embleya sp. NBC_00896]